LSSITKKGEIKSASRPPRGFCRIDDQHLDIYPYVESFVVYDTQKGNMDDEINFYMSINDQKGIEDIIFYLSSRSSVLSRGIYWVS
jgi:NifU-like protein involved in Fe-S cluster formation